MAAQQLHGFKELDRALKQLPGKVAARKVVAGATRSGATVIRKEMRILAPVRDDGKAKKAGKGGNKSYIRWPGHLQKHIITRTLNKGPAHVTVGVGPDKSAFYARFYELGTEHQSARPFMRPAFDGRKGDAVKKIGQRLWVGIKREAGKLRK